MAKKTKPTKKDEPIIMRTDKVTGIFQGIKVWAHRVMQFKNRRWETVRTALIGATNWRQQSAILSRDSSKVGPWIETRRSKMPKNGPRIIPAAVS